MLAIPGSPLFPSILTSLPLYFPNLFSSSLGPRPIPSNSLLAIDEGAVSLPAVFFFTFPFLLVLPFLAVRTPLIHNCFPEAQMKAIPSLRSLLIDLSRHARFFSSQGLFILPFYLPRMNVLACRTKFAPPDFCPLLFLPYVLPFRPTMVELLPNLSPFFRTQVVSKYGCRYFHPSPPCNAILDLLWFSVKYLPGPPPC